MRSPGTTIDATPKTDARHRTSPRQQDHMQNCAWLTTDELEGDVTLVTIGSTGTTTPSAHQELCDALYDIAAKQTRHAVILAGDWSALDHGPAGQLDPPLGDLIGRVIIAIDICPHVVIAAVGGRLGAPSATVALSCDIVIASGSFVLDSHIRLDDVEFEPNGYYGLRTRRVVTSAALTNTDIDAESARAAGLVHRRVPHASLINSAHTIARHAATGRPHGDPIHKRNLRRVGTPRVHTANAQPDADPSDPSPLERPARGATAMSTISLNTLGIAEFSLPSASDPTDRTREVRDLTMALRSIADDDETRAVVLRAGPTNPTQETLHSEGFDGDPRSGRDLIELLTNLPAAVIASIDGEVASPLELAIILAADIVIASPRTRFRFGPDSVMAATNLGLLNDGLDLITRRSLAWLMLTDASYTAEEAERVGFVTRVAVDERLDIEIDWVVGRLNALGLSR
ncbi:MAG: enoyl-CoA hydratase, partial [Ilumatobacteraceae bacterium]|nr:enoyl-CoA hydratase [Ilumatobacteraceae bacterium]